MKSKEEIDQLKANWLADACWDIEDTEGFEDHRDELKAWADPIREKSNDDHVRREYLRKFNEPAFARPAMWAGEDVHDLGANGLSKREYFAGLALQGLLAGRLKPTPIEVFIPAAIEHADALIIALETEPDWVKGISGR